MAVGDFTKAYERSGANAIDSIQNLFKNIQVQRQKADSQQAIAKFLSDYNSQAQKSKGDATTHPSTPMQSVQPIQPNIGQNITSQLTGVNFPQAKQPINTVAPLKDENAQGSYVGTQLNPYQQNKNLGQGYVQSVLSLINHPDITPEDRQTAIQALGLIREQNTAQLPQTIERDPRKEYIQQSFDDSGKPTENIIQKGKEKLTKFDEHINDKGHRIVQYQDDAGNLTEKDLGVDYKSVQDSIKNKNDNRRLDQNDTRIAKSESGTKQIANQLKLQEYKGQLNDLNTLQPEIDPVTKKPSKTPYVVNTPTGVMFLTEGEFNNRKKTLQNKINVLGKNLSADEGDNTDIKPETKNTSKPKIEY